MRGSCGARKTACYVSSMNGREFWALSDISDQELEGGLSHLLGAGARVEARIVAHLAEVETRRLHLLKGCSSLYDYCRKQLSLSDYEAFVRIAAARVARKYPIVFEMLERRELHLTAVCEVRDFLTSENHAELLGEISGKTKLQIREILARRFPQADVPGSLKKLPALEPLSPGRYRLLLTLSAEHREKLELARDLLSHANPSGDLAVVLERALDVLVLHLEKRRFGKTKAQPKKDTRVEGAQTKEARSRRGQVSRSDEARSEVKRSDEAWGEHEAARCGGRVEREIPEDRSPGVAPNAPAKARHRKHISHEVRRRLGERDGARCAFVSHEGVRCDSRAFLQFHHRQPWARGGGETVENLEVMCRAHNRLLAERDFGAAHMEQFVAGSDIEPSREAK
jgi:hypothetical protein